MRLRSAAMAERPPRPTRASFPRGCAITTRWMDNDVYGHVNNVVYYSWFDTAVGRFLMDEVGLRYHESDVVGLVVETQCRYHAPVSFPEPVDVRIACARIGTSSVRYEIGVFVDRDELAIADGHFVHVYVDRATHRPVPVPDAYRTALATITR